MNTHIAQENSSADRHAEQSHSLRELFLLLALGLMLFAPGFAVASTAASLSVGNPEVAGEVQFMLGQAWVSRQGGSLEALSTGDTVGPRDIIQTSRNGHVHLRFVDNAFIVVKPASELEILQYRYDPENPAASVVKLNLREGIARSVSGKAAKQARDQFRLNTPIAAIGVRGTDFTVNASRQAVRAKVFEGAIVIAPFSGGCSAEAVGPCIDNARELASSNTEFVELVAEAPTPQVRQLAATQVPQIAVSTPAESAPSPVIASVDNSTAGPASVDDEAGTDIYTDSVTTLAVNTKINENPADNSNNNGAVDPVVPETPDPVIPDPVEPEVPGFTPAQALTVAALTTDTQLVWGRWQERNLDEQRITVDYDSASQFGTSAFLINGYALFREMPANAGTVKPGLGTLSFGLDSAQAVLRPTEGASEPVDVLAGTLSVNFDERAFSTSLDLFHPATGDYQFTDSGITFSDGRFLHREEEQSTVGATTLDGSQAGYYFERQLEQGSIQGVTLWSGQP